MAANVNLLTLRTRARKRADERGSPRLSDSEVNDIINEQLSELYDLLVMAAPPHYYYAEASVPVTGAVNYPLPSDFRTLIDVWSDQGSGRRKPLRMVEGLERAQFVPASQSATAILAYVPAPPTLLSDSDTFDGISGWDALIVRLTAKQMIAEQEDDTSTIDGEIGALESRIRASSKRVTGPRRLPDVCDYGPRYYNGYSSLGGYALRQGVIELYEPAIPYF